MPISTIPVDHPSRLLLQSTPSNVSMISMAFQKDSFKLKAAVRQTEGISELQFKTLMDMTYSMAHGRTAMVRQARIMDA